jgi:hypothetical protein
LVSVEVFVKVQLRFVQLELKFATGAALAATVTDFVVLLLRLPVSVTVNVTLKVPPAE